ncbi:ras guanine nucleotide exchange factor L-like [Halichondria panicea]|uniref:ras guanine nucleotide exchange factor L-like n=1 Tax=Halichondria panicea TaxID=6063 RepID=UPI00312B6FD1
MYRSKPPPGPARSRSIVNIKKPSPPVTPKKLKEQRKVTDRLVRRLSQEIRSPMGPIHVTIDYIDENGEDQQKRVYVTEVNGTRTLDLYSGWNPDTEEHKFPLEALPATVCTLINLQRLWVSHNLLSTLPADLDRLVNLKEMFLHGNMFEDFPISICSLKSIEILWLSSNKIKSIPNEIGQLKTLKRLHLDGNKIRVFPPALCTLTGLEVLYLNKNLLEAISDDIGNLSSLKRLYLQSNQITDIPSGICKLKTIKMLFLDHNKIHHVHSEFRSFKLQRESNNAKISLDNNPSTPQNKSSKLSLTSLSQLSLTLKARRHSDQHDQDIVSRRPLRVSLPQTRPSESLPAELHLHYQARSASAYGGDRVDMYKADTLPRSGAVKTRRSTYHEH